LKKNEKIEFLLELFFVYKFKEDDLFFSFITHCIFCLGLVNSDLEDLSETSFRTDNMVSIYLGYQKKKRINWSIEEAKMIQKDRVFHLFFKPLIVFALIFAIWWDFYRHR